IRPLLDIGCSSKTLTDQQRFTFGTVELGGAEQIVRNEIGEPRIGTDIDVQAIGGQVEAVETSTRSAYLLEAACGADPQCTGVLGSERVTLHESGSRGPDFIKPGELGITVYRARQHEHA